MTHCDCHLTAEERAAIMLIRGAYSIRAIAQHLGRAVSIISRELARHTVPTQPGYDASLAGFRATLSRRLPRRQSKLRPETPLFDLVAYLLRQYWSPKQIALTLKRMYPDDATRQVSHESIYNALYVMPRSSLKRSSLLAFGRARARGAHVIAVRIAAIRSQTWSVFIFGHPRSKIDSCRGIGKETSSWEPAIALLWVHVHG